jgi:UDP-3-O-acyl-N-acetylglucosamine deacetylase
MSALAGLEVTDAEVEVEGGELPALDGSSIEYVHRLKQAGFEQLGEREIPDLFTRVFLQEDDGLKVAVGKGSGHWRYIYDVGHRWPYKQEFESSLVTTDYETQIAPARTLALAEELDTAMAAGLGKGLDESSCVILESSGYRLPPRFSDEPARHKLLDLIGDLYLSGVPIRMLNVVAERSGHRSNVQVANMLIQAIG